MSWKDFIKEESNKDYFIHLTKVLDKENKNHIVYPKENDIFNAFRLTTIEKVKVVILGMDPYINAGQAHGLSFSVPKGVKIPPSLRNVFKEIKTDLNIDPPTHGNLESWATQGVFLLNSVLTVRAGESGSHSKFGWQKFTDAAIMKLNARDNPIAFLLWGNYAKSKSELITNPVHATYEAMHPSPLAQGKFFGCKHFSKANDFLIKNNIEPIDWQIK